jgi:hypothetical protein
MSKPFLLFWAGNASSSSSSSSSSCKGNFFFCLWVFFDSEEEAKKSIYSVSTTTYTGFGALISEELSYKVKGIVFLL